MRTNGKGSEFWRESLALYTYFSKRIRIKCLSAVSERPDLTNQAFHPVAVGKSVPDTCEFPLYDHHNAGQDECCRAESTITQKMKTVRLAQPRTATFVTNL
ncbi:hypothetical protein FNN84_02080 [Salmonella enterica subsp. salamae]|uniref:Uncharacterized protein n=1 Tax=Salmonella enterica subsp. salamae TaxID=59202 RepID=A0A5Y2RXC7_SALER|nr:hypothetical protein [Salmonella enterica subsp. salamae]ECJ2310141.1 hypothetical protein [Salmonella enterica subsp. salamae]